VRAAIDGLPTYMRPHHIYLSGQALPLSLSGKIRRQAIRRGVMDGSYPCEKLNSLMQADGPQNMAADEKLLQILQEMFAEHTHTDQPVSSTSHFFADLGGDSLAFLELIGAIETRFDVKITNEMSMEMTAPAAAAMRVAACLDQAQRRE